MAMHVGLTIRVATLVHPVQWVPASDIEGQRAERQFQAATECLGDILTGDPLATQPAVDVRQYDFEYLNVGMGGKQLRQLRWQFGLSGLTRIHSQVAGQDYRQDKR